MNKYTGIMVVATVTVALLLAGCQSLGINLSGSSNSAKPIDVTTNPTGSQGVEFSFLQDRPQSTYTLTDGATQDITVAFHIENDGYNDMNYGDGASAPPGYITINYDPSYFSFKSSSQQFPPKAGTPPKDTVLKGKNQLQPRGESMVTFFSGSILPLQEKQKNTAITAVLCYPYATDGDFDVCIDTDPGNVRPGPKACTVVAANKKTDSTPTQGAPIAVTHIGQTIKQLSADSIELDFLIKVSNVGDGKVYATSTPAVDAAGGVASVTPQMLCTHAGDAVQAANRVTVTAKLAGELLSCTPDGPVYIPPGSDGLVNCRSKPINANTPSYASSLHVHIAYNYVTTQGVAIILNKAGAQT